jgi:hypothetical protein
MFYKIYPPPPPENVETVRKNFPFIHVSCLMLSKCCGALS